MLDDRDNIKGEYKESGQKLSPLEDLFESMYAFYDSLILCRANMFVQTVATVRDRLTEFAGDTQQKGSAKIFQYLSKAMIEKPLFKAKDIEVIPQAIKWCLDNGHIMQALALFCEKYPEYLFKSEKIRLVNKISSGVAANIEESFAYKNCDKNDQFKESPERFLLQALSKEKTYSGESDSESRRKQKEAFDKLLEEKRGDIGELIKSVEGNWNSCIGTFRTKVIDSTTSEIAKGAKEVLNQHFPESSKAFFNAIKNQEKKAAKFLPPSESSPVKSENKSDIPLTSFSKESLKKVIDFKDCEELKSIDNLLKQYYGIWNIRCTLFHVNDTAEEGSENNAEISNADVSVDEIKIKIETCLNIFSKNT